MHRHRRSDRDRVVVRARVQRQRERRGACERDGGRRQLPDLSHARVRARDRSCSRRREAGEVRGLSRPGGVATVDAESSLLGADWRAREGAVHVLPWPQGRPRRLQGHDQGLLHLSQAGIRLEHLSRPFDVSDEMRRLSHDEGVSTGDVYAACACASASRRATLADAHQRAPGQGSAGPEDADDATGGSPSSGRAAAASASSSSDANAAAARRDVTSEPAAVTAIRIRISPAPLRSAGGRPMSRPAV